MKLHISKKAYRDTKKFSEFVLRHFKAHVFRTIDYEKVSMMIEYCHEQQLIDSEIDEQQFIAYALNSYRVVDGNKYVSIDIDPNITFEGMHRKIIVLCRLLEFGNMQIKSYPILTKSWKSIERQLPQLYDTYMLFR